MHCPGAVRAVKRQGEVLVPTAAIHLAACRAAGQDLPIRQQDQRVEGDSQSSKKSVVVLPPTPNAGPPQLAPSSSLPSETVACQGEVVAAVTGFTCDDDLAVPLNSNGGRPIRVAEEIGGHLASPPKAGLPQLTPSPACRRAKTHQGKVHGGVGRVAPADDDELAVGLVMPPPCLHPTGRRSRPWLCRRRRSSCPGCRPHCSGPRRSRRRGNSGCSRRRRYRHPAG